MRERAAPSGRLRSFGPVTSQVTVAKYLSEGRDTVSSERSLRVATLTGGETSPHYSRGFATKPLRRQARRAHGPMRRGFATSGSSEGGVSPSWGFYKGTGPLVRVGEAGSRAEPAREEGIFETVC